MDPYNNVDWRIIDLISRLALGLFFGQDPPQPPILILLVPPPPVPNPLDIPPPPLILAYPLAYTLISERIPTKVYATKSLYYIFLKLNKNILWKINKLNFFFVFIFDANHYSSLSILLIIKNSRILWEKLIIKLGGEPINVC